MPKSLEKQVRQAIVDEGDLNCPHSHVFYIDNSFEGQAFWCDDCSRHEYRGYSQGVKIKFPIGALISTPNLKDGTENFYAFRSDHNGEAQELSERVKREKR